MMPWVIPYQVHEDEICLWIVSNDYESRDERGVALHLEIFGCGKRDTDTLFREDIV